MPRLHDGLMHTLTADDIATVVALLHAHTTHPCYRLYVAPYNRMHRSKNDFILTTIGGHYRHLHCMKHLQRALAATCKFERLCGDVQLPCVEKVTRRTYPGFSGQFTPLAGFDE